MIQPPDEAQPALAAIHAAGGDELVQAMLQAFSGFATAQMAWIERQFALRQYDGVAHAARALGMSASQIGAVQVTRACQVVELAGAGEDAAGVAHALETLGDALATAHAWIDGDPEADGL
jgi:HPt (histidine-containing phosphotransfer) domain-containing protein